MTPEETTQFYWMFMLVLLIGVPLSVAFLAITFWTIDAISEWWSYR